MAGFEHALILLLVVTALKIAARGLPWPEPITYAVGGAACAFLPGFPRVALDPGFFFLCFLPPLLFADGWLMPLREFSRARRPIFLLATGLVVFTTLGVGLVAHALVPGLPLPMAFALGALVSPTDAVAVSAITERLKVPTRLTTVLSGESLMNDATGLVAFKFALAAVAVGTFSLKAAAWEFVVVAGGGLGVGLAVGYGVGRLRDLLIRWRGPDPMIEITLSLLTPYMAYLAAEPLHLSGILAVVAAGLYCGWRDPVRMDPETRQTAWAVWSTVLFWLNGLAFVLLGLQFPHLVGAVEGQFTTARLLFFVAAISAAAMALRIAWFFPGAYLPRLLSRRIREAEERPSWRVVLVGGWAGMRGAVTLAAALSIPLAMPDGREFPERNLVIFLSFGVIAATLLIQGTTLEWLIRRLGIRGDGLLEREERLARIAAVESGLAALRALEGSTATGEEAGALAEVIGEYERRSAELVAEGETQATARERLASQRRYELIALEAERRALDDLWQRDVIVDEVHRPLQQLLDHEEAMLRTIQGAQGG